MFCSNNLLHQHQKQACFYQKHIVFGCKLWYGMCVCFGLCFVDNYIQHRSFQFAPGGQPVTWAKGHEVTEIQGSEHAAKTLIVVSCQHITDINHKASQNLHPYFRDLGKLIPSKVLWKLLFLDVLRVGDRSCRGGSVPLTVFEVSLGRIDYLERDETN